MTKFTKLIAAVALAVAMFVPTMAKADDANVMKRMKSYATLDAYAADCGVSDFTPVMIQAAANEIAQFPTEAWTTARKKAYAENEVGKHKMCKSSAMKAWVSQINKIAASFQTTFETDKIVAAKSGISQITTYAAACKVDPADPAYGIDFGGGRDACGRAM